MKQKIYRIDIHNFSRKDAECIINIQLNILPKSAVELEIIHGYHSGHVLQDFLRKEYKNKRIKQIETSWNNGITIYRLK